MIKRLLLALLLVSTSVFGFNGGDGTQANPYQVATPEHLNDVRNFPSAHFIQVNSIDIIQYADDQHFEPAIMPDEPPRQIATGWVPIGDSTNVFTGHYNGNGMIIDNLQFERLNDGFNGLFGYTDKGSLKNITLTNVDVKGRSRTEALVGRIRNCQMSGNSYSGIVVEVDE